MAFKLLIEVSEKGQIDASHEGQIDPIIILGALRKIEHNLLMTMDVMEAEMVLGKEPNESGSGKGDNKGGP